MKASDYSVKIQATGLYIIESVCWFQASKQLFQNRFPNTLPLQGRPPMPVLPVKSSQESQHGCDSGTSSKLNATGHLGPNIMTLLLVKTWSPTAMTGNNPHV